MSDLEKKMEELVKLKPELVLEEGLEDFQKESAEASHEAAVESWQKQVDNLQKSIDGEEREDEQAEEE